jgi:hypothetical protein
LVGGCATCSLNATQARWQGTGDAARRAKPSDAPEEFCMTHKPGLQRRLLAVAVAAAFSTAAPAASAANVSWVFPGSGDWGTATNWSTLITLPNAADDVFINLGGTRTVTVSSGAFAARSVALSGNNSLALTGGQLTVLNTFASTAPVTLNGGTLVLNGASSIGTLNLVAGALAGTGTVTLGALNLSGGVLGGSGTATLTGALSLTGAPLLLDGGRTLALSANQSLGNFSVDLNGGAGTGAGTLVISSGRRFTDITSTNSTISATNRGGADDGLAARLINEGQYVKRGLGETIFSAQFVNTGTMSIEQGRLTISGVSSHVNADTTVMPGGVLRFTGGLHTLDGGKFSGDGEVQFRSTTVNANGAPVRFTGNVELVNAFLRGSGDYVFEGRVRQNTQGSAFLGAGVTTFSGPLTLETRVGNFVDDGRQVDIAGVADTTAAGFGFWLNPVIDAQTAGGRLRITENGRFIDRGVGTENFFARTLPGVGDDGSSMLFTIAGTYEKTGTARTLIDVPLVHTGRLDVQAGVLAITHAATLRGRIDIASGAQVEVLNQGVFLADPRRVILDGPTIVGAGTLKIDRTTLSFDRDTTIATTLDLGRAFFYGPGNVTVTGATTLSDHLGVIGVFQSAVTFNGMFRATGTTGGGLLPLRIDDGRVVTFAGGAQFGDHEIALNPVNGGASNVGGFLVNDPGSVLVFSPSTSARVWTFDHGPSDDGRFATFINRGTVRTEGPGVTTIDAPFVSIGAINVESGTLRLVDSVRLGGSIDVATGASLVAPALAPGVVRTTTIDRAGLALTGGGTTTFDRPVVLNGVLDIFGANGGEVRFEGGLSRRAGFNETVPLRIDDGRTVVVSGGADFTGNFVVQLNPDNANNPGSTTSGRLVNEAGSVMRFATDNNALQPTSGVWSSFRTQADNGSDARFVNRGTLRSGGSGQTVIFAPFESTGRIEVEQGRLDFQLSTVLDGSIHVAGGASLAFTQVGGSLVTLRPSLALTGDGQLSFRFGPVAIEGDRTITQSVAAEFTDFRSAGTVLFERGLSYTLSNGFFGGGRFVIDGLTEVTPRVVFTMLAIDGGTTLELRGVSSIGTGNPWAVVFNARPFGEPAPGADTLVTAVGSQLFLETRAGQFSAFFANEGPDAALARFVNQGVTEVRGDGLLAIRVAMRNEAALVADRATISIEADSENRGSLVVANGGSLQWTAGIHTMQSAGATFMRGGAFVLQSPALLRFETGAHSLENGTLSGTGTLRVMPGAQLNLNDFRLSSPIDLAGGELRAMGAITVEGPITVTQSSTLTGADPSSRFVLTGPVTVSNGTLNVITRLTLDGNVFDGAGTVSIRNADITAQGAPVRFAGNVELVNSFFRGTGNLAFEASAHQTTRGSAFLGAGLTTFVGPLSLDTRIGNFIDDGRQVDIAGVAETTAAGFGFWLNPFLNGQTTSGRLTITSSGKFIDRGVGTENFFVRTIDNVPDDGSSTLFTIAGTYEKTGTARTLIDVPLLHTGRLDIQAGVLAITNTANVGGAINIAAGAQLEIANQRVFLGDPRRVIFNGGSVSGAGVLAVNETTVSFDTDTVIGSALNIGRAAFYGAGNLRVTGPTTLTNHLLVIGGTSGNVRFEGMVTMTSANSSGNGSQFPMRIDDGRTVTFAGGALLTGGELVVNPADFGTSVAGRIVNEAGSTFVFRPTVSAGILNRNYGAFDDGRSALFSNAGTVRAEGPGVATIGAPFVNTGAVQVVGGTLRTTDTFTHTGSINVSGGLLDIAGGVQAGAPGAGAMAIGAAGSARIGAASTLGTVSVAAGGALTLDAALTINTSFTNANAGFGNTFNRRGGINGTGQLLAGGAPIQTVIGNGIADGSSLTPTITLGTMRAGTIRQYSFSIANTGNSPALRGALQTTGANGGNLTDAQIAFGPANFGPGSVHGLTFTPGSAGALSIAPNQRIAVVSQFDNVATQLLSITVDPNAKVYTPAVLAQNLGNVDFGVVRVGDAATRNVGTIGNSAAATALNDVLTTSFSGNGAPFTLSDPGALGGGQSTTLTATLDTSAARAASTRNVTATFASHNPDMADLARGSASFTLTGQVNNLASAAFKLNAGPGTLVRQSTTSFLLDFGDIARGATGIVTTRLAAWNRAPAGAPSDRLVGALQPQRGPGSGAFVYGGFSGRFDLDTDQSSLELLLDVDTTRAGQFTDTLLLRDLFSVYAGLTDFALPQISLDLRLTVSDPATSVIPLPGAAWLLLGGLAALGATARRRRTA